MAWHCCYSDRSRGAAALHLLAGTDRLLNPAHPPGYRNSETRTGEPEPESLLTDCRKSGKSQTLFFFEKIVGMEVNSLLIQEITRDQFLRSYPQYEDRLRRMEQVGWDIPVAGAPIPPTPLSED